MGQKVAKIADDLVKIIEESGDEIWEQYGKDEKAFVTEVGQTLAEEEFALISATQEKDKVRRRENIAELLQNLKSESRYVGLRLKQQGMKTFLKVLGVIAKTIIAIA